MNGDGVLEHPPESRGRHAHDDQVGAADGLLQVRRGRQRRIESEPGQVGRVLVVLVDGPGHVGIAGPQHRVVTGRDQRRHRRAPRPSPEDCDLHVADGSAASPVPGPPGRVTPGSGSPTADGRRRTRPPDAVTVVRRRVATGREASQRANSSEVASATSVRTPKPLPPLVLYPRLSSVRDGPAMSRWAHGTSPTNSRSSRAAADACRPGPGGPCSSCRPPRTRCGPRSPRAAAGATGLPGPVAGRLHRGHAARRRCRGGRRSPCPGPPRRHRSAWPGR